MYIFLFFLSSLLLGGQESQKKSRGWMKEMERETWEDKKKTLFDHAVNGMCLHFSGDRFCFFFVLLLDVSREMSCIRNREKEKKKRRRRRGGGGGGGVGP
ncbi:hypothetical protein F5H01DRAFT_353006 [Linnemannia elongata]|nr:hypothetical protein F5H01DRAFT_353006 [Linnemannia elongata]